MRYARFAFVIFGFATGLMAADPFIGTWNMNSAKSKYSVGTAPKEQTVTIAETGSDLDVTVKGTSSDGTAFTSHYTVPAAGGEGKIIESRYDAVSGKRMGSNQRDVTYTKGGKVALTAHSRISGGGKTMTVTVKGTDMVGKPEDAVLVFDKQ